MDLLIFPHQIYADHPGLKLKPRQVVLIEDSLFFGDWNYPLKFHKQKLWLHRATMKRFEHQLQQRGFETRYFDYDSSQQSLAKQLNSVCFQNESESATASLSVVDPTDFILEKRIREFCEQNGVDLKWIPNPGFINDRFENVNYRSTKKRWFMADFYKWQRKRLNILMEDEGPTGGRWSFDDENRKKVPKNLLNDLPELPVVDADKFDEEAQAYVQRVFPNNPGKIETTFYPTSHDAASDWLKSFLKHRFVNFGLYEDAIVENESWLWHSVLTPSLNIGLLTPNQVVKETLEFAESNDVPLNSLEGFIRQVIGWREFMRATYEDLGVVMRTNNHWNHNRKIPDAFYNASTGIPPIDDTIRRILETGYCHHIERLMVLGGFMFLCELNPKDIYQWFMEMFVDSYDWVMVPNVYAMSQHADGGLITTKPYFSGSSYIRKMSHHKKGDWCEIWDGLYWRWIWNHADELAKNPRWAMMCSMARKMDPEKRDRHLSIANDFLDSFAPFSSKRPRRGK